MSTPQYLLAKYIPDLRRGEPRNIGVIVWTPDAVEARFLGEKPGFPGEVDGRSIPSFVTSAHAYRQWIEYWRLQLSLQEILPPTGGPPVGRGQKPYLDALRASSKGNFSLVEAGFLLDRVSIDELPSLADHLFTTLVDAPATDEPRDPSLDDVIETYLTTFHLRDDRHFKTRLPVPCSLSDGTREIFEFDYGYQNGTLRRLYQRVPFLRRKKAQQTRVDATAWKFECVHKAGLLGDDKPVALVLPSDEQRNDADVQQMLRVLAVVGRVLDLRDPTAAEGEFRLLRSLGASD